MEKGKDIHRKFRIVQLEAVNNRIMLTVTPLIEEKPELKDVIAPKFRSEDERIGYEIGKSMMKGMAEIMMPPGIPMRRLPPIPAVHIDLSKEEYAIIGSPNINTVITVNISITIEK